MTSHEFKLDQEAKTLISAVITFFHDFDPYNMGFDEEIACAIDMHNELMTGDTSRIEDGLEYFINEYKEDEDTQDEVKEAESLLAWTKEFQNTYFA